LPALPSADLQANRSAVQFDPKRFWQKQRATIGDTRLIAGLVCGLLDQAASMRTSGPETLIVGRNHTHLFKQM